MGHHISRRLGHWRSLLLAGWVIVLTQTVLALTSNVVIAAGMLMASSAAFALFNIVSSTMRQRHVPAGMLGRVTSLYQTVAYGGEALGALAGGALVVAGIRAPMLVGAVPLVAMLVFLSRRSLADLRRSREKS